MATGPGLVDYIYQNLNVPTLDRNKVFDYLNYLKEIMSQEASLEQTIKYYSYKVALENRLVQLDLELVKTFTTSISK